MFDDFKRGCDCFKRGAYSEALHYFRVAISDYGYYFDLNAAAHVGYCHEKGYGLTDYVSCEVRSLRNLFGSFYEDKRLQFDCRLILHNAEEFKLKVLESDNS